MEKPNDKAKEKKKVFSTREERAEKKEAIRVTIDLFTDGSIQATGPMNDPVLYLGILELAKLQLGVKMTAGVLKAELTKGKARPRIVLPS